MIAKFALNTKIIKKKKLMELKKSINAKYAKLAFV